MTIQTMDKQLDFVETNYDLSKTLYAWFYYGHGASV